MKQEAGFFITILMFMFFILFPVFVSGYISLSEKGNEIYFILPRCDKKLFWFFFPLVHFKLVC
jgi:hypothetical protein